MFVLVRCSFSIGLVLWISFFFEVIGELVIGTGLTSHLMTEPWYQGEGLLLVKLLPALCLLLGSAADRSQRAGQSKEEGGSSVSKGLIGALVHPSETRGCWWRGALAAFLLWPGVSAFSFGFIISKKQHLALFFCSSVSQLSWIVAACLSSTGCCLFYVFFPYFVAAIWNQILENLLNGYFVFCVCAAQTPQTGAVAHGGTDRDVPLSHGWPLQCFWMRHRMGISLHAMTWISPWSLHQNAVFPKGFLQNPVRMSGWSNAECQLCFQTWKRPGAWCQLENCFHWAWKNQPRLVSFFFSLREKEDFL